MSATAISTAEWGLWSTTARLVVADPTRLSDARNIADELFARIDEASSRFRGDSELTSIAPDLPRGVEVSPTLAMLVRRALEVAALTDGLVDPTLGRALSAVGYDRDIRLVTESDRPVRAISSDRPGWRSVVLAGHALRVPGHLSLDLGASAKAVAADLAAEAIAARLHCGVLVSLGGDIATAGRGDWTVLVQDLPADPATTVSLAGGFALATSSTQKRGWTVAGERFHHILDPFTGLPAETPWRSVTVSARSCLTANAFSTAAIVAGEGAVDLLDAHHVSARLVHEDGHVVTTGLWPVQGWRAA